MVGTTGDTAATPAADLAAGDKGAESSARAAEAPGSGLGAHGKKVSTQDIQLVQNLIERCLQMYMGQREVHRPSPTIAALMFTVPALLSSLNLQPTCMHILPA